MDEADSVSISVYDVMTSWFTPSCIFLIVNLVIGTIAITSRFAAQRNGQPESSPQLVRSTSSLFERVTSFGLGCCKYIPTTAAETTTKTVEAQIEPVDNCDVPQLDQDMSPTKLDRVKSIDPGLCKTEINKGSGDLTRNTLPRAPSLLERLMSGNFRRLDSVKVEEEKKPKSEIEVESEIEVVRGRVEEEEVDAKAAPSLLVRLLSRNFRRLDSAKVDEEKKPKSELELESETEVVRGKVEEEEVDAKADDFIKRFKQQLRLERLESILRCRDILNRH